MPKNVLVASPHHDFAELLRSILVESGRYHVSLAASGEGTLRSFANEEFDLAILDIEIPDQPLVTLCQSLLQLYPHLNVVVIHSEDDPNHPSMVNFHPHAYLPRSAPPLEILLKIENLLHPDLVFAQPHSESSQPLGGAPERRSAATPPNAAGEPPQSNSMSRQLDHLLPEFSVKAAVVANDESVIACAGDLKEGDAGELFAILGRHRDRSRKTEIASFVRLHSRKETNLLYATPMTEAYLLATVEDAAVPLSQARANTLRLAHRLGSLLSAVQQESTVPEDVLPVEQTGAEDHAGAQDAVSLEQHSILEDDDLDALLQDFNLNELLAEMPSLDPEIQSAFLPFEWECPDSALEQESTTLSRAWERCTTEEAGSEGDTALPPDREWQQSPLSDETVAAASSPESEADAQPVLINAHAEADLVLPWEEEIDINPSDDTVKIATQHGDEESALAKRDHTVEDTQPPAVAAKFRLAYAAPRETVFTCILIPRLKQHALSGALAEMLPQWVAQYCAAFGWNLEKVEVFPEYLQWTVEAAPTVSPGSLVRSMRQRTSEVIFDHYPDLKERNTSGDYWAPVYLVIRGNQPPTPHLLQDFIDQTRRRMGSYRF